MAWCISGINEIFSDIAAIEVATSGINSMSEDILLSESTIEVISTPFLSSISLLN